LSAAGSGAEEVADLRGDFRIFRSAFSLEKTPTELTFGTVGDSTKETYLVSAWTVPPT
jgi:hypothetical protein